MGQVCKPFQGKASEFAQATFERFWSFFIGNNVGKETSKINHPNSFDKSLDVPVRREVSGASERGNPR